MHNQNFTAAILTLAHEVHKTNVLRVNEFEWFKSHHKFITKSDLIQMEKNIMSQISNYAATQSAFNDRQEAAVLGISGSVSSLNDTIKQLQSFSGSISVEDQTSLDNLIVSSSAITAQLEALSASTSGSLETGSLDTGSLTGSF